MEKWFINTELRKIKLERKRLLTIKEANPDTWERDTRNRARWSWMVPWLAKTNNQHIDGGSFKVSCKMCEKLLDKWLECEFSFCEEYDCGMQICKECAEKIYKLSHEI